MRKLPLTEILPFYRFIFERQRVWHNRHILMHPSPWTQDEVLKKYKFCNTYRELDKGTIAITNLIQNSNYSASWKLFNIIAYRFFNKAESISELFDGGLNPCKFSAEKFIEKADILHAQKAIFNDAYVVSPQVINPSYRPKSKHVQIAYMLEDLVHQLPSLCENLGKKNGQYMLEKFSDIPMVGSFLAGQILLDCTYSTGENGTPDLTSLTANDFLIVGPGAHWGLNILWGQTLNKTDANSACRYLFEMQKDAFNYINLQENKNWETVRWQNAKYHGGQFLALHDIQNSLCEFRKHHRLTHEGAGRKRIFRNG